MQTSNFQLSWLNWPDKKTKFCPGANVYVTTCLESSLSSHSLPACLYLPHSDYLYASVSLSICPSHCHMTEFSQTEELLFVHPPPSPQPLVPTTTEGEWKEVLTAQHKRVETCTRNSNTRLRTGLACRSVQGSKRTRVCVCVGTACRLVRLM